MPTIELKLPRARLPRALSNTIEHLPGRPPADIRRANIDLTGLQEIARRIPTPDISNLELPKVEISKVDLPKVNLSKIEIPESIVDRLPTQLVDRLPKRRRSRVRLWLLAAAGIVAATIAIAASWNRIRPYLNPVLGSDEVGSDALPEEAPGDIWSATPSSTGTAGSDATTFGRSTDSQPSTGEPSIDQPIPVTTGSTDEADQPVGVGVMGEHHSNGAVRS